MGKNAMHDLYWIEQRFHKTGYATSKELNRLREICQETNSQRAMKAYALVKKKLEEGSDNE